MPSLAETAYPRLKNQISSKELLEIYTPTDLELQFASQHTKGKVAKLGFLVLLKTFQRLGYFVLVKNVPDAIIKHIVEAVKINFIPQKLENYDRSGTRWRHLTLIRDYLKIIPYGVGARRIIVKSMAQAAQTKNDLADLINVAIEELVHHQYELPIFTTLVRAARRVRATISQIFYRQVADGLNLETKVMLDGLLETSILNLKTPWYELKQDAGKPILKNLKALVERLKWIDEINPAQKLLTDIPDSKVKYFAAEAMTLDAARMKELELNKRYTLTLTLIAIQAARTLDDIAEMFIKRMLKIHFYGQEALTRYRQEHQARSDRLITTLRDVVIAYSSEGQISQKFTAIETVIGESPEQLLEDCEAHIAYAGNNYYPFLWRFYKSHRSTLFQILRWVKLQSTTQDTSLEEAIEFLSKHQGSRKDWLKTIIVENPGTAEEKTRNLLNLDWIPTKWWQLITNQKNRHSYPTRINRKHFEVCVFSQVMWELKSGDLYVEGSDAFADYRKQQISWSDYKATVANYGELVNLPVEGKAFVVHLKEWLSQVASQTDKSFPKNEFVRLEDGKPIIQKTNKKVNQEKVKLIESLIRERLHPVNILDILTDTELWLNWTRFFHPISGYEAKIDHPIARYLTTTFCYGCHLGASQTARSLGAFDHRQVAWVNQRHITEETLDKAITSIINAYNRFSLPKFWGTGKRASADGTKWDIYEQNLLAEYHIRYGGYGGIGYYHVSDTYIALFSHFIPCGVWEAVYILDGLLNNQSEIQPDVIHADTQGQSAPVFGLAYLLGINLMPRIRNWHDLKLYRPTKESRYHHIDGLFSDVVDWDLIETHLPDMLRVVLSIKAGKFTASTILRKLGTYSRHNRLYQSFSELGLVIRTGFLLSYLSDEKLRLTIQAALNKSESFNGFTKWVSFGGSGLIPSNNRDEQRKMIKYNHLVSNCLIFYNVFEMTRILQELIAEGYAIDEEIMGALSPYLTKHINRFGRYSLDLNRKPPDVDYDLSLIPMDVDNS
ncbi:transposase, TnpA family (plasmid) [Cylindrospermum stagnale PCC 7417]|uniref:Transposase, TnpA family n=1 Tax=Cylindrospermum stagnale PCC 7417 TaxID=56107 RepID=K9X6L6_9NOST|nr:Tn3 family transposase [Cylindrospermum stagnale]AFZ24411.1 transposase, TnpA family [Cylindrospermum stagnale PCC 7417]AFZ27604.1 transposase, TnpA family [Cylindrospermum stagnale PCC 7417]AFZ28295.1 transposase, TnpA family [Cylindrospermum stagnale PCC 7417]